MLCCALLCAHCVLCGWGWMALWNVESMRVVLVIQQSSQHSCGSRVQALFFCHAFAMQPVGCSPCCCFCVCYCCAAATQFAVKHEQDLDCGGGYIKLLPGSRCARRFQPFASFIARAAARTACGASQPSCVCTANLRLADLSCVCFLLLWFCCSMSCRLSSHHTTVSRPHSTHTARAR